MGPTRDGFGRRRSVGAARELRDIFWAKGDQLGLLVSHVTFFGSGSSVVPPVSHVMFFLDPGGQLGPRLSNEKR